jgi:hypothetical protein
MMEPNESQPTDITAPLRAMQIVAGALMAGVVFFGVIVIVNGSLNQPPKAGILSFIGVGFAALMFVLHLIVPGIMAKNVKLESTGTSEVERWCGMYQTKMIIAFALLEGAAFLNLVACMSEHNWWSLAVAGGLVLIMAVQFPTRTRVEQWIETQRMNNP